jgi:hypothetical protein
MGRAHREFAATRLVQNAAAQACPQDVKFGLAHRPLQTEQ